MQRLPCTPRPDWKIRLESIGFLFHTLDGIYWEESACYRLSTQEVDEIENATNELQRLCLAAVEHVIRHDRFGALGIPAEFARLVCQSWEQQAPSLYGRFDLTYNGHEPPKMLEYNADTPTALFEASVTQWFWLQDVYPERDQFNAIHEQLLQRWPEIARLLPSSETVYFASQQNSTEDFVTTEYLRDTAVQAGLTTATLDIGDIGYDSERQQFVDADNRPVTTLFKLYPWEWMIREGFGQHLLLQPWRVLEPPWKMILSNKGLLPILWELFPAHPNLLPAYFDPAPLGNSYVRKPRLSREGANVSIYDRGQIHTAPGDYDKEGWIYQSYQPLPVFDGHHAVIGSWIIGENAAGIGIREDNDPITRNTSRFVPHYFD